MGTFSRLSASENFKDDVFSELATLPNSPPPVPINDLPCDAISLSTKLLCTYASYDNLEATNSEDFDSTIPNPSCGNYNGGDVWFTAKVPSSGEITIEVNSLSGGIGQLNFIVYSGTCTSLYEIGCYPSTITKSDDFTGRTPHEILFIRVYDEGNDELVNFQICASGPCADVVADAGFDGESCDLNFTFNATGSGEWSEISAPQDGSIISYSPNNTDSIANVAVSTIGEYEFEWKVTNGVCTDTDTVMVDFIQPPFAVLDSIKKVCSKLVDYLTALPSVGTPVWRQESGPSSAVFDSTTYYTFFKPEITVTEYGTYEFILNVTNRNCSAEDTIIMVFYEEPTIASVAGPLNSCGTLTSEPLSGNTPSVGIGTWSQVSGPGIATFSNINSGNATATVDVKGEYLYQWSIRNDSCPASTADISVSYYDSPTNASVGIDQEYCNVLTSLSLGGNTPVVGIGSWSQISGTGTSTFSSNNSGTSTATATDYGTYVYRWTIGNETCDSTRAELTVNFYETPTAASVGSDQDICSTDIITTQSGALGGNNVSLPMLGTWSQVSGPGTNTTTFSDVNSGNSTATPTDYGTYVYRWTIGNGNCDSTRAELTINFYEIPSIASVGEDQNQCATLTSTSLGGNEPTAGTGTWSQVSGPGTNTTAFSDINSGSSTATPTDYGTYVYRWTIGNGTCDSTRAELTVSFYEKPTAASVGFDQDICSSDILATQSGALGGNNVSLPMLGTWSQVSGPGTNTTTFSDINSGSSTATPTDYGTYVYRWTINNGTCTPSTADITVNFYQTPTTATVGSSQDQCGTLTSLGLGGNTPTAGTGSWSQFSGPGTNTTTFSDINSGISTATATDYGTYVYRWTIGNGTCASTEADITVNFYQTPTTATVGSSQDQCGTLTSTGLGGNTPVVGTGSWTQVLGTGTSTFSNDNSGTSTATATAYGTYVYRWTIGNETCDSTRAELTVNFYETPTAASVGSDQDICSPDILTTQSGALGGNNVSLPMLGTWSQESGPGTNTTTFSDINSGSSTATPTDYGTYVYRWTIGNGTCDSTRAELTVNFYKTPTAASVGSDQDICSSNILATQSGALGGNNVSLPMLGTWSQVSGPETTTFSNINSGSSTARPTAYGTYVYRWTINNGTCTPETADVSVNFYESPTTATVGSIQERCGTLTSTSLGGNTAVVGTGIWSQVSGPSTNTTTFSTINSGSSTATASDYGTYIYRWTIGNGTCTPSTADITVNFYQTPSVATVGSSQDQCGTLTSLGLGGNTPTAGTGLWSQFSGPGTNTTTFSDINSGISTATATDYGTYVYRWIIGNGTCDSTEADITVNFYQTPTTAAVGSSQDQCGTLTSTGLSGNTPVVGTGSWSQILGTGTSTFSNDNSGSSAATASDYGTYIYRWTIGNETCDSTRAELTVNFYETPSTATVGSNQDQCATLTSTSLGGNTPVVGTGTWSQESGPGSNTTTFSDINSGSSTATATDYGTYVYRWTINNGTCTPSTADITVNFYQTPTTATVGSSQDQCGTLTSLGLGGNTPTAGTGSWSQFSGPGTNTTTFSDINSGSSTATATDYGTYVYRWTIGNGTCASTEADITVNFYQTPTTATVGSSQDQCGTLTSTGLGGNTPVVGTGSWTQVLGTGTSTFSNDNSGTSTATATAYGTYVYRWTIGNETCDSTRAELTVNFYETPTAASVGSDQDICSPDILTTQSGALGGNNVSLPMLGTWSQESGPGTNTTTFSDINSGSSTATPTDYGTYVYRWTIGNGTCDSTRAELTVNFYKTPTAASVGSVQDICSSDILTTQSGALGGNNVSLPMLGTWSQVSGPGTTTFSNINSGSSTAKPTAYGTYVYRWTINNGTCTPETADVSVNFYESPTTATVGSIQERCGTLTSISLGGNTPTAGTGSWSQLSGPGTSTFSSVNSGGSTATVTNYGTYVYRWTIANETCTSSRADISVTYYQAPSLASVGVNQNICSDLSSTSLGGNTPWVGIGSWSQVSGLGTTIFSNVNFGNAIATASQPGSYIYRWTISNGSCTSNKEDIVVNFYEGPTVASAGGDQSYCDVLSSISLGANAPTIGSGSWTQISGPSSTIFSSTTSENAIATVTSYGTYLYRWTIANGICISTDDVTINFNQTPVSYAGTDDNICGGSNYAILGSTSSNGIIAWSTSGSGTFDDNTIDNPTYNFGSDESGIIKLTKTVGNLGCSSVSDDMTITFIPGPTANAGTGGNECDLDFTLSAVASVGVGTWTNTGGLGNAVFLPDANTPNATVNVDSYGTYDFTWTELSNGCTDSDNISISFFQQPVADAGVGGDECAFDYTLSAISSSGLGSWTKESGLGNISFSPNANDPKAIVTTDIYGSYKLRWTETNGSCMDYDEIIVNFYEQPIVDAGTGGGECDLDFIFNAIPSVGSGKWTQVSGPGTSSFFPNSSLSASTVTVSNFGSYQFLWTETNGNCTDSEIIDVDFYDQPVAIIGNGGNMCGLSFSLTATPSVGNGTWTKISGSGNASFSPNSNSANSVVTVDAYDTYSFRWTEDNGSCTASDEIIVNFYEQPIANSGFGGDQCGLEYSLSAIPSAGLGVWQKISGNGNVAFTPNANSPDATVTVDAYDSYQFMWTEISGECSDNDIVNIIFQEQPIANAGLDINMVFADQVQLNAVLSTDGTGEWTVISGNANLFDRFSPNTFLDKLGLGENILLWTETNQFCNDSDEIKLAVDKLFIPTVITPNGDDRNEYFIIRGSDNLSDIQLSIFNRGGVEIFTDKNYKNNWNGLDRNGIKLPMDTYFYVIKLKTNKVFKGYVVIKR
ncbi:hypothetical protein ALGA_4028 [Labilibaculum antarcticum]|uniref:PKD domain-containing protein n=2 Tax=Labilibaculum antarcticum TaxID=1717717 RepID=A0A1Y1CPX4_9BACT|nr:hypothetical protein ALGA_4028 [Labilibaculum antarcticum]